MASIDINKLIQESMETVMAKTTVEESTTVDANVDDNMNTLHENMKTVIESGDKLAGEYLRGEKKIPGGDNKVDLPKAGKMLRGEDKGIKDTVKGYADKAAGYVKKGVDKAAEYGITPGKAGVAAAGAAGLVGAGVMAKKYLARKKAGK